MQDPWQTLVIILFTITTTHDRKILREYSLMHKYLKRFNCNGEMSNHFVHFKGMEGNATDASLSVIFLLLLSIGAFFEWKEFLPREQILFFHLEHIPFPEGLVLLKFKQEDTENSNDWNIPNVH